MDEANTLRLLSPSCGAATALSALKQSIIDLMVGGRSDVYIMDKLGLSRSTLKRHKGAIYGKLGLPTGDRSVNLRVMTVTQCLEMRGVQDAATR